MPLADLDALAYDFSVTQTDAGNAPTIHVTVTGLTHDSHFESGLASLTYTPTLSPCPGNPDLIPQQGVTYHVDAFAPGTDCWYSTTEPTISQAGGQDDAQPLSYFIKNDPSAVITQISLDNGGSSGSTAAWAAGADDLLIGISGNGAFTRYDFGG